MHTVTQQHAIGQIGECVVVGYVLKLALVLLVRGDVGKQCHVALRLTLVVAYRADGLHFGINLTIFSTVPDFAIPITLLQETTPHALVVVSTLSARTEQTRVFADDLTPAITCDAGEGIVDIKNGTAGLCDHDAFPGRRKDTGCQQQTFFGRLAGRDVTCNHDKARFFIGHKG